MLIVRGEREKYLALGWLQSLVLYGKEANPWSVMNKQ
jgi:hypothetical protein